MTRGIALVIAIGFAAGCGQERTPSPETGEAPEAAGEAEEPDPQEARDDVPTLEGWQDWEEVSRERMFSEGHSDMYVEIYLPPDQVDAYLDEDADIPADMTVVKPQYESETAEEPEDLTVMIRDEDAETGWIWAMYSPDGAQVMDAGQIEMCTACHAAATDDMLFRELE